MLGTMLGTTRSRCAKYHQQNGSWSYSTLIQLHNLRLSWNNKCSSEICLREHIKFSSGLRRSFKFGPRNPFYCSVFHAPLGMISTLCYLEYCHCKIQEMQKKISPGFLFLPRPLLSSSSNSYSTHWPLGLLPGIVVVCEMLKRSGRAQRLTYMNMGFAGSGKHKGMEVKDWWLCPQQSQSYADTRYQPPLCEKHKRRRRTWDMDKDCRQI